MKKLFAIISSMFISWPLLAQVSEERSSAFVAGAAKQAESFGHTDGPLCLAAAATVVVGIFACLILGTKAGINSKKALDSVEKMIGENDE